MDNNVDNRFLEERWTKALKNDDLEDYELMVHVGYVTLTSVEMIHCIHYNAINIAKWLIKSKRINVNYANPNNPTEYNLLEIALSHGNLTFAEMLRQEGAKPSGRHKHLKMLNITHDMVDTNSPQFSPMAMASITYVLAMGYIPEYNIPELYEG